MCKNHHYSSFSAKHISIIFLTLRSVDLSPHAVSVLKSDTNVSVNMTPSSFEGPFSRHWPINKSNFTKKLETKCCQMHLFPPCVVSVWLLGENWRTNTSSCFLLPFTCLLKERKMLSLSFISPISFAHWGVFFHSSFCSSLLWLPFTFSLTKHWCVKFFSLSDLLFFSSFLSLCPSFLSVSLSLSFSVFMVRVW